MIFTLESTFAHTPPFIFIICDKVRNIWISTCEIGYFERERELPLYILPTIYIEENWNGVLIFKPLTLAPIRYQINYLPQKLKLLGNGLPFIHSNDLKQGESLYHVWFIQLLSKLLKDTSTVTSSSHHLHGKPSRGKEERSRHNTCRTEERTSISRHFRFTWELRKMFPIGSWIGST